MRLRTKLLLICEVTLLVVAAALLFPLRSGMRTQVTEDLQNQLAAVAATAVLGLDGDLHHAVDIRGGAENAAFHTLRDHLRRVRDANGLQSGHLYTFAAVPSGSPDAPPELRFAVMPHEGESFIGEPYPIKLHHRAALLTGQVAASELYDDHHGHWISAAAPIRDAAGRTVGLLEVTQPSDVYFARYDNLAYWSNLVVLLGLILTSLLGYFVLTRLVLHPVRDISDGVQALGDQRFTHRIKLQTRDEFQDLGESLNSLAEQFNTAKRIQAGFFPERLPKVDGYSVHGLSEPCDATGGDYYDAIDLGEGRMAVVVADVTGHGLGPSLLMASCRSALRALAHTDLSPAALIDRLENQLMRDLIEGRFITMIFGVLHPCGRFDYANAGHSPAMMRTAEDGVVHLPSHRPPLGIQVPLDEPPESSVQLHPGDRILLASDGVNEAQAPDRKQFGYDPIEALMRDNNLPSDALITRLRDDVARHRGAEPANDDVTILCIDRRPENVA